MEQDFDRTHPEESSSSDSGAGITDSAGEASAGPAGEDLSRSSGSSSSGPEEDNSAAPLKEQDFVDQNLKESSTDTKSADQEGDLPKQDLSGISDHLTSGNPAEETQAFPEASSSLETLDGSDTSEDPDSLEDRETLEGPDSLEDRETLEGPDSVLSSDLVSSDSISEDQTEEILSEDGFPGAPFTEASTDGDLYALILDGFQVTHELMVVQTGLLALIFAMLMFRFVYHLISHMVTKFD